MTQRTTMVAVGASVAVLVYSSSLVVQRFVPALKVALELSFENVRPTYYLRVVSSLVVGVVAAFAGRRRSIPERQLAWGMTVALAVSVVLACACP